MDPVTIKVTMILQRLWQSKVDWDDSVPSSIATECTHLKNQLFLLVNISIPRRVTLPNSIQVNMHGFCDASQCAYGTCILHCLT